jgi:hypothetical protein
MALHFMTGARFMYALVILSVMKVGVWGVADISEPPEVYMNVTFSFPGTIDNSKAAVSFI